VKFKNQKTCSHWAAIEILNEFWKSLMQWLRISLDELSTTEYCYYRYKIQIQDQKDVIHTGIHRVPSCIPCRFWILNTPGWNIKETPHTHIIKCYHLYHPHKHSGILHMLHKHKHVPSTYDLFNDSYLCTPY
jgi:hypothetical protein